MVAVCLALHRSTVNVIVLEVFPERNTCFEQ